MTNSILSAPITRRQVSSLEKNPKIDLKIGIPWRKIFLPREVRTGPGGGPGDIPWATQKSALAKKKGSAQKLYYFFEVYYFQSSIVFESTNYVLLSK